MKNDTTILRFIVLKYQDAIERTRQAFSILQQAISEGELQDMFEGWPGEYRELLKLGRLNRLGLRQILSIG